MSQASKALKEIEQFARALRNASIAGDEGALRGGMAIAASYLELCKTIISNPLKYILSNKDPFSELRPLAQTFIDQWLHRSA